MKKNELYHYGVIGMKWGVHRKGHDKYVRKAEKFEAKAAAADQNTFLGKHRYFKYSDKAKDYRYMAKTAKRMQDEDGFLKRHNAKWGYAAKADRLANKAAKYDDRAKNRRFTVTRAYAGKKASIIRRNAKMLDAWANTPIRTLGGRERTADQRKAEAFVDKAWGLIGLYPVSKFYHEFKGFFKNNN